MLLLCISKKLLCYFISKLTNNAASLDWRGFRSWFYLKYWSIIFFTFEKIDFRSFDEHANLTAFYLKSYRNRKITKNIIEIGFLTLLLKNLIVFQLYEKHISKPKIFFSQNERGRLIIYKKWAL